MQLQDPEELREIPKTWREYLEQAGEILKVFRWTWRELGTPETKRRFRRSLIAVVFMTIFDILWPRFFGVAVDGVGKRSLMLVGLGMGGFFLSLLLQKLSDYWYATEREHMLGLNQKMLDRHIDERFYEKSMGQHVEESFRLNPENISTGRERLLNIQGIVYFDAIPSFASLAFSYIFLWFFVLVAGTGVTVVIAIYLLWMLYLNRAMLETCTPLEIEFRQLKRYRVERWKLIERVKVSAKEDEELAVINEKYDAVLTKDLRFWLWFIAHCCGREIVGALGLAGILSYGIWLTWIHVWPIGNLFPLLLWSAQVIQNLWRIGHTERLINWNMPGVRSMIAALSIPPNIVSKPNAIVLSEKEPVSIVFDSVVHSYPLDGDDSSDETPAPSPVLKNVSFAIQPGEKVALIGESGSGKTTLMKLLLRFMDPTCGSIRVNGHDLRDLDLVSWMWKVGYIPQQDQILDGTFDYNLKYALSPKDRAAWTDERMWKFMKSLSIDFGGRLTQGLATIVGERGVKLSGGQAQRVMIGAAAIRHPPFMLIDEATSHLDSSTEKIVHNGLKTILSNGISALVIAHRLSTVRDLCDRFVVLRNAQNVKDGESQVEAIANSFEELYAVSPSFRQLADDQNIKDLKAI